MLINIRLIYESWEAVEQYCQEFVSMFLCYPQGIISKVKKHLYSAAVNYISGEAGIPQIVQHLLKHSKLSVSDSLEDSMLFLLTWSPRKNYFDNADNVKESLIDALKFIEKCVIK